MASPNKDDMDQEEDITAAVSATMGAALDYDSPGTMDEEMVAKAATEDTEYQLLFNKVPCLRPYFTVRDRLSVVGSLVIYTFGGGNACLVVPALLRHRVATYLHVRHQGLDYATYG